MMSRMLLDASSFFEIVFVFPPIEKSKTESCLWTSARNVHIFLIGKVIFQNLYH